MAAAAAVCLTQLSLYETSALGLAVEVPLIKRGTFGLDVLIGWVIPVFAECAEDTVLSYCY